MLRLMLAATALALPMLASPAAAQRAGFYAVEGVGGDGTRYTGAVQFTPTGPQTWRLSWRVGGETINGIGVSNGKVLAVAYTQGGTLGAVLYDIGPDGTMLGSWTAGREGGVGTERLIPR
ncbi:hypothetical protein [Falsiroseomonas stagni]|uniref:Extracellular repeat, HAF family n=1 Tax=Falsiroseomonas stagni DSM 19981 TaxID=1123062 RepID=A0A1I4BWY2_9PROT|nr:hypothetical protein [Falsiroseomonas stagni]SFK73043.1 hypothetical protein SAMN02745775_106202 [Falsiroseomonas stagni DSM 19981]